jgi:hypothetical protein
MYLFKKIPIKEMEETILQDTQQINKLYEEIDYLKNIIKEKDIEITILNDKNKILNRLIEKNNIVNKNETKSIPKFIPAHKLIEEDEIFINNNYQRKEFNVKMDDFPSNESESSFYSEKPIEKINDDDNIFDSSFCWEEYKKHIYIYDNEFETYYNKYYTSKMYPDKSEHTKNINKKSKIRRQRNKELPILERFIAIPYDSGDIKDSEVLQYVSSEDSYNIKYQYMITEKINKKIEDITIDEVVDFKMKYNKKTNSRTIKMELKHKIERCEYLYKKYKENLSKFRISLSDIRIMSIEEWEEWKIAFDKLYNETFNNYNPIYCTYKYKGGRICNKLDCNIKTHK